MKCPLCGNENLDSTRFCIWCAASLDNAAQAQPEQTPAQAPVAPVQPSAVPVSSAMPNPVPTPAPAQTPNYIPTPAQTPSYIPGQSAIPQPNPSYGTPNGGMNTPIQAAYVAPGTAAPKQVTNVLCILGFIFSLVSIFCCGLTAIVSLILSLLGLIFASKKSEKGKGLAIAGLIVSALMLAVFIVSIATGRFNVHTSFNFGKKLDTPEKVEEYIKENNWIEVEEGSYLEFKSAKSFRYYRQYDELDDYYYSGTYELYVGEEAMDFLEDDLSDYGVTREEVEDLADRDELYKMENLVVLVLHNEEQIVEGEDIMEKEVDTPYFGFFVTDKKEKEHALDIVNANHFDYCLFVPEDEYEDAKKSLKD